ncbi:hypothetical protein [Rickettsiella endosymbiont of Rhagonycha lignosa]|uniref:hypothetical protein n=1 Tax=Rickettsiella endosymbiont of Rhagonycha lignosa TaxID=3077937 RepID=UPI00313C57F0
MKKNIIPFIYDTVLIENVDSFLKFVRQPLPLDELWKKIPNDILNAKLGELEFKSENRNSTEYFIIKFKDNKKTDKAELHNGVLSELGITVTDKTQSIHKLINYNYKFTLKKSLKKIILSLSKEYTEINVANIITNSKREKKSNIYDNNEANELFFILLKALLLREITVKESFSAHTLLDWAVYLTSWFISDTKKNIYAQGIYYSEKYNEIDALIYKLNSFHDTQSLATQLLLLNNQCLQELFNIVQIKDSNSRKAIEVIEWFQSKAKETIIQFQENNFLSLDQLTILHKILNAIAKLIPSFILQKKTRIGFFQQCTPQNKILLEIEKIIQPHFIESLMRNKPT